MSEAQVDQNVSLHKQTKILFTRTSCYF